MGCKNKEELFHFTEILFLVRDMVEVAKNKEDLIVEFILLSL